MDSNQTTLTQKEFAKQEIIRINAQPATTRLEKQHKQQLLEHYQRILNTNPLSDQEIAKSEQGQLSVIYQGNQSFADWEATIDKNKVTRLEIAANLENNNLVIKDYPNLRELYALNRKLKTVEINAPNLEILNLSGNWLKELNTEKIPLIKKIDVSANERLKEIKGLKKLENLAELVCYECNLAELDVSNKKSLKKVFAANQYVSEFKPNFQDCDSLEIIDVAENNISSLNCSNLSNLKDVSCKEVFFRFSKLDFGFIVLFNNLCDNIEKKKSLRVHSKERLSKKTILKELEIILSQKRYYLGKKEFLDLFRKKLHFSRPLKTISLEKLKNIFFELSLNANFNNCTSLEKLNFSKSTISNLNLDNTPNLKEVIGGWMDRDLVLDEKGKEQYMLHAEPFGKDFVIGEVVDDDSDCESDDMEDSDQEEIEYNSRTLTRAEYDKLSEQIAKKEVDINKYRKKIKTKLVKPERDYDAEPWYNPAFWEDKRKFPRLVSLHLDNEKANIYDDPEYGETIARYETEEELKKMGINPNEAPRESEEAIITDPSQLSNSWPELTDKYRQQTGNVNIAGGVGHYYAGTLIIDGWQSDLIDVGNNHFSYLVVKNCQNLRTLIYAHNMMKHDAFIDWDTCPNLRPENVHKENYDGGIDWACHFEERLANGEIQAEEEKSEKNSEKDKEFQRKLDDFLKIILELIAEAEHYADQGNWKKVQEKLELIKSNPNLLLINDRANAQEIFERVNKLERRLEAALNKSESISYWGTIIVILIISLSIIGLTFWFINKQIKKLKLFKFNM